MSVGEVMVGVNSPFTAIMTSGSGTAVCVHVGPLGPRLCTPHALGTRLAIFSVILTRSPWRPHPRCDP